MSKNSNNNHSIGKYYGYYIFRGGSNVKVERFLFNEGL